MLDLMYVDYGFFASGGEITVIGGSALVRAAL